jgi:FkbM family methyltransferase
MSKWLSRLYDLDRSLSGDIGTRLLRLAAAPITRVVLARNPDPPVEVDLGPRRLWINWSHNLPGFLRSHPNYEGEIGRVASFLHRKRGRLVMIDVGANVGDTIATMPELEGARFLCIEGSKRFFGLLVRNFGSDTSVCCVNAVLTDGEGNISGRTFVELRGTAHLDMSSSNDHHDSAPVETLDALVNDRGEFASPDLLKIDTDGFDFRVIKGASKLLARSRPILHFELAFTLWEQVGATCVSDALLWLSDMGYRTGILYDNLGYLIATDAFATQVRIQGLREYAQRRKDWYVNVIAFHEQSEGEEEFLATEREHVFQ